MKKVINHRVDRNPEGRVINSIPWMILRYDSDAELLITHNGLQDERMIKAGAANLKHLYNVPVLVTHIDANTCKVEVLPDHRDNRVSRFDPIRHLKVGESVSFKCDISRVPIPEHRAMLKVYKEMTKRNYQIGWSMKFDTATFTRFPDDPKKPVV